MIGHDLHPREAIGNHRDELLERARNHHDVRPTDIDLIERLPQLGRAGTELSLRGDGGALELAQPFAIGRDAQHGDGAAHPYSQSFLLNMM